MLGENPDEEVTPEEDHRSFAAQHPLSRIAIAAAGPLFNLLLAFFLFCGIYLVSGYPVMIPEVGQVRPGSPADKAGIEKGDVIEHIEGKEVRRWEDIKRYLQKNSDKGLHMGIIRGDKRIAATVYPELDTIKNIFGEEVKTPLIGIVASGAVKNLSVTPLESIQRATGKTWEVTSLTILTIVKLLQGVVPFKTVGGPILIGQLTGEIAKENLSYLFPFMAVISINLAILNLLPVPVLDGGMIIFLLIELIIGKPISLKKRELAQKIGFFLLILLMAFVFYNDLARIIME
jgi:regulator of sigma E protease